MITRLAACFVVLVAIAYAQEQVATKVDNTDIKSELVAKLTRTLKVTPEQAKGGAGAIFGFVKSRLNASDFGKLATSVPQMDEFLKAAPPAKKDSIYASLGSMVPGGSDVASLAGSFESLGLSPAMIGKFAPVIEKYVKARGGPGVAGLVGGVLK